MLNLNGTTDVLLILHRLRKINKKFLSKIRYGILRYRLPDDPIHNHGKKPGPTNCALLFFTFLIFIFKYK